MERQEYLDNFRPYTETNVKNILYITHGAQKTFIECKGKKNLTYDFCLLQNEMLTGYHNYNSAEKIFVNRLKRKDVF